MTIKRRLFLSNILMLVVPTILSFIMFTVVGFIYISVTGIDYNNLSRRSEVETLTESWTEDTDLATIKSDIAGFYDNKREPYNKYFYISIMVFNLLIVIILLTNRVLTHYVSRSIIEPINTLIYGVHQIRDGNLEYRIEYAGKDEFASICSDFNEMALRLSDYVEQRQKDETNRKELIAGISHDLRTPLTSIKAYLEGIEKGVASTPQIQKKYLDTIKYKTTELEHIINQLFMFSKIDIGEFPFNAEKVSLGKELGGLIGSLSEEYEKKGLTIAYTVPEKEIYIKADIQQFRNAITNIIENSLKYKVAKQGELDITTYANKESVTIKLKDNGPGVSEDALDQLFHIFYRGDQSRNNEKSGSGLGLAITAKILERLDGNIWAENSPKGGLIVVITLPIFVGGKTIEKNTDY